MVALSTALNAASNTENFVDNGTFTGISGVFNASPVTSGIFNGRLYVVARNFVPPTKLNDPRTGTWPVIVTSVNQQMNLQAGTKQVIFVGIWFQGVVQCAGTDCVFWWCRGSYPLDRSTIQTWSSPLYNAPRWMQAWNSVRIKVLGSFTHDCATALSMSQGNGSTNPGKSSNTPEIAGHIHQRGYPSRNDNKWHSDDVADNFGPTTNGSIHDCCFAGNGDFGDETGIALGQTTNDVGGIHLECHSGDETWDIRNAWLMGSANAAIEVFGASASSQGPGGHLDLTVANFNTWANHNRTDGTLDGPSGDATLHGSASGKPGTARVGVTSPEIGWRNLHPANSYKAFFGDDVTTPAPARIRDSLGSIIGQLITSPEQDALLAKFGPQGDNAMTWVRVELTPSSFIGRSTGQIDSALHAALDRYHAGGVRNFLILWNTRLNAWGALANDGDYDDGTHAGAITALSQSVAARLLAQFPDCTRAWEVGNEVVGGVDGGGNPCIGKYFKLYQWVYAGIKTADANALVSPGSTLVIGTNLAGYPSGAGAHHWTNFTNTGPFTRRSWSQTDWTIDACTNPGNVLAFDPLTSDFTLTGVKTLPQIGADFYCPHPYCTIGGPNETTYFGVNYPSGDVRQGIVVNGFRELAPIAVTLIANGLQVPLWGTECGWPTAPSYPSVGTLSVPTNGHVFAGQGSSPDGGKQWDNPPLYRALLPTTSRPPGSSWHTYTSGEATTGYNQGQLADIISTENAAGQHVRNALQQWFGLQHTVDGVNLGPFTGVLFVYLPVDWDNDGSGGVKLGGFTYGLSYGAPGPYPGSGIGFLADKGNPASAGPYQQLKAMSSQLDTRGTVVQTKPEFPVINFCGAGNALVLLTWTAPVTDGGSPITDYRITIHDLTAATTTTTNTGGALFKVISPLVNGHNYNFTVAAINAIGTSAESPTSITVTPNNPPPPPTVKHRVGHLRAGP